LTKNVLKIFKWILSPGITNNFQPRNWVRKKNGEDPGIDTSNRYRKSLNTLTEEKIFKVEAWESDDSTAAVDGRREVSCNLPRLNLILELRLRVLVHKVMSLQSLLGTQVFNAEEFRSACSSFPRDLGHKVLVLDLVDLWFLKDSEDGRETDENEAGLRGRGQDPMTRLLIRNCH
jgi:hypothetical protein